MLQQLPRLRAHGLGGNLNLHETLAGARQRLFKEVQCIIIIKNFDRVRDGHDLLGTGLFLLLVHFGLAVAILIQVGRELFVLLEALGGVLHVVLHLGDADAHLRRPRKLLLDRLRQRGDLLFLGGHEALVLLNRRLLGGDQVLLILQHLIAQLLKKPDDLAARRSVAAGQESEQVLFVAVLQGLAAFRQRRQGRCRARLEEASGGPLFQGGDGLVDRGEVDLALAQGFVEGRLLLLTQGLGLGHGVLRCGAVGLVLRDILLQLGKFSLRGLDARG
mmetsp:Transcript_49328/g.97571  ORF Transcript_49328/g.97571 Transcript_49328/m.97571 type:complete len:275 (-) Transcript_49328:323-1147(-)